ncbi:MAG: NHL repeat-containing protein, partial [Actinomycetota bacterium]|nr:NHL repeat-containing protein [Actinomycetota bacterium]
MGSARGRRGRGIGAVCALVLAATSMVAQPVKAATGDITTFAGGLGQGVATNVSQTPTAIATRGPLVYTTDSGRLVRVLDRRTGVSKVFAGDGRHGPAGDGGPATDASFWRPQGIAVDGAGNVYISDGSYGEGGGRIRRVGINGIITRIAGGGTSLADGVQATEADLEPHGLAFDAAGNLHVADGSKVRRIDAGGRITTVAGTGVTYPFSGDGGQATSANMTPVDIDFDEAGNLYIADRSHHRIRRIGTDGVITTIAGNGEFNPFVEGAPATEFSLVYPDTVDVHGGSVYLESGGAVLRVDPAGIATLAASDPGGGPGGDRSPGGAGPLQTDGVEVDTDGTLYVADSSNGRLQRVDLPRSLVTVAGNGNFAYGGDGGPAVDAQLSGQTRMAFDAAGNLFVSDAHYDVVRRIDVAGTITTVADFRSSGISGIAFDPSGRLHVADPGSHRVLRLEPSGAVTVVAGGRFGVEGDGGPATQAAMYTPSSLAFDAAGHLFVMDTYPSSGGYFGHVRRIDATTGIITTVIGGRAPNSQDVSVCDGAADMAFDSAGRLLITERGGLVRYDLLGGVTRLAGGGTAGERFGTPVGDGGPATDAYLFCPRGVIADGNDNIYLTDPDHQRVRRINAAGIISTVAGGGPGYTGDG